MKRGLKLVFSFLFLFIILTTFISASPFSDFWDKITGKTIVSSVCGNGVVESGEQCDGNDYPNDKLACNDWSTTHRIGRVYCSSTCTIDTSKCIYSGNTTSLPSLNTTQNISVSVNSTELPSLNTTQNISVSVNSTESPQSNITQENLTSLKDVNLSANLSTNPCGNGDIDAGEQCDGTIFRNNEKRCGFWNSESEKTDGNVRCNTTTCKVDVSTCSVTAHCGGKGDACNSGSDCCSNICRRAFLFFPKKCTAPLPNCGNKIIDSGEQCDLTNLGGKTCESLGYDAGTLSCSNQCKYTGCRNVRSPRENTENDNNNQRGIDPNKEIQNQLEEQRLAREYQRKQAEEAQQEAAELARQKAEVEAWEQDYLADQLKPAEGENPDCVGMACPN